MAASAPASQLRQIFDQRLSQMLAEAEEVVAEARERARRELADQLNQAVRRIRQSADTDELVLALADAAGGFASGVIVLTIQGDTARVERMTGAPGALASMEIPLASAAALAGAVESRDAVIAVTTPREVSAELVNLLEHSTSGRVSIFPAVVRGKTVALVYGWGTVQGPALELVTQVASAAWTELMPVAPPPPAPPDLITIAVAPAVQRKAPATWEELPAPEQEIHLRAQRFARVQTAEMRLRFADAVQAARLRGKVYETLKQPVDEARAAFRELFFAVCPSMVDYLHLELVRTLANDDVELLGKEYPGPMA